jgi:hypothetical protein
MALTSTLRLSKAYIRRPRRTGHHGHVADVPELDDDQLAALRRLRAAFAAIEVIAVTSNHPANEQRCQTPGR